MGPSTHRARSYSSSDDDLLPIEVLKPWLYKGTRSPEKSRYVDPAEEAIEVPRTAKEASKTRATSTSTSRISSRQASASPSPSAQPASKGKEGDKPTPQTKASENRAAVASTSKADKRAAHRTKSTSASTASSRDTSVVPDSEAEVEVDLLDDRLANLVLELATPQAAKLTSNIFGKQWSSSVAKPDDPVPPSLPQVLLRTVCSRKLIALLP